MDPKRVVEHGYDRIAERHAAWAEGVRTEERERYAAVLLGGLPEGAAVLELGCGAGGSTTRALAERFNLTGVDLSERSVALARESIPNATFPRGDMTTLDFPPASFDGVAAFYSIIHVPREEQPGLLGKVAVWLRPSGLFMGSFGVSGDAAGYEEDWLGVPMYWSSFDAATNRRMIEEAGLEIISVREEMADEDGAPVAFLWVVARKPTMEGK